MTLFPRLAILGLALIAAIPGARAQQSIGLVAGDAFNLYGLNVDVSSCTIGLNGATAAACTATNKLELLQVASPTNTITYEIVGYTGTSPGSSSSAALSASTGISQLNLTLLVTPNAGYHTSTTRVTGATLTSVGEAAFYNTTSNPSAQASAAFSAGTTAARLTTALTPEVNPHTPTVQTVQSGSDSFSPDSASFTITENLQLDPHGRSVNLLSLRSVALKFTTTPEPASIAILLAGLAGITWVRWRRVSQASATRTAQS